MWNPVSPHLNYCTTNASLVDRMLPFIKAVSCRSSEIMIPSVTVLSFLCMRRWLLLLVVIICYLKEDKQTPKWNSDQPVPETRLSYLLVL